MCRLGLMDLFWAAASSSARSVIVTVHMSRITCCGSCSTQCVVFCACSLGASDQEHCSGLSSVHHHDVTLYLPHCLPGLSPRYIKDL